MSTDKIEILANKKILFVDDDINYIFSLKNYFNKASDFDIFLQSNPKNVLEDINKIRPYFVVLDYDMPYLSGLDVLNHINQSSFTLHTIFLTNFKDNTIKDEYEAAKEIIIFYKSERRLASKLLDYFNNAIETVEELDRKLNNFNKKSTNENIFILIPEEYITKLERKDSN